MTVQTYPHDPLRMIRGRIGQSGHRGESLPVRSSRRRRVHHQGHVHIGEQLAEGVHNWKKNSNFPHTMLIQPTRIAVHDHGVVGGIVRAAPQLADAHEVHDR